MSSECKNSKHNERCYENKKGSYSVYNSKTINKIGDNVKIIHDKIKFPLFGKICYIVTKDECMGCEFNILVNIDCNNYVWCKKNNILTIEKGEKNNKISDEEISHYFDKSIDIDSFINDFLVTLRRN